tara:strand:+ start:380 stop:502 length:123 start_codon:yes stop_codon:yes gene_type:complete
MQLIQLLNAPPLAKEAKVMEVFCCLPNHQDNFLLREYLPL